MNKKVSIWGVIICLGIILSWLFVFNYNLTLNNLSYYQPSIYLLILLQTHLYTGLFISAHDAMHGTLAPNPKVNQFLGTLCTFLYAGFWFNLLKKEHHKHHEFVHSNSDPDYYEGHFWKWYFQFMWHYITWYQLLTMAIVFNILQLFFSTQHLLLFWILPSLLSTLQLFYFGTWLPHHGEHQNKHHSRSLSKNHFWAFITCYFFGYHYEHHEYPQLPWWQLYKSKSSTKNYKFTK